MGIKNSEEITFDIKSDGSINENMKLEFEPSSLRSEGGIIVLCPKEKGSLSNNVGKEKL